MTIAMGFPAPAGNGRAPRGARSARSRASLGFAPRSSGVRDLLADARRCVALAMGSTDLAERYAAAHLGALRGAAAVLACYPKPTSRTVRNASAWVQLERVAPEYGEWVAYFAAGSAKRKAAEAGITRLISAADADDLIRQTAHFLDLIDESLRAAA